MLLQLDLSTLAFISGLTFVTQSLVLLVQYLVNRTYPGLGWWLLGSTLWALGVIVLPLVVVPALDSLARIGNPLIVLGNLALYIGVMRFLGRQENRPGLAALFLVFILAYYYFMYVSNSLSARTAAITAASAVTAWLTAAALFFDRGRISRGAARFTALVFFSYGCFLLVRLAAVLVSPPLQSYSDQRLILALAFVVPMIISMLAIFGFTLMVNQRLSAEAHEARDRLQLIFDTSPDAVMIARLADGLIVDVNAGFLAMSGYARAELIGNTLLGIDLWQAPADRERFSRELSAAGVCESNGFIFQRKDGSQFTGSISAKTITLQTIPHFISVVRDNTEREKAAATSLKLATLEERARLARALHDSVNQSIHGLVLFAETLVATLDKHNTERAQQLAQRLQENAQQALKETRLMLYELQPAEAGQGVNFIQDLERRLGTVERHAGVKTQLTLEGALEACLPGWSEHLFWITIEALNNTLKHAQARNVRVQLRCFPDQVDLDIVDDGKGFDPATAHPGGLGCQTMRDRAHLLGGELALVSAPGQGTRVSFRAEIKPGTGQPHD